MDIKQDESEFAEFPADQVVDWLGHPVTEHLKKVLSVALADCDRAGIDLCIDSPGLAPEALKSRAMAIGAGKKAYQQLQAFIEEAANYVKA
jgi:hypothetical protein